MKRKFWLPILSVMAVSCLVGGLAACGKQDKEEDKKEEVDTTKVVLADFEEWAPDFQILRTMENFGAVDVNEDVSYVKSGKQSAKLYVMGNEGSSLKPYIYLPTVSEYFDFDYSKFEKFEKVTAWLYNPNEAGAQVEIGAITEVSDITNTTQIKCATKELQQGWNEVVWNVNASFIATATGFNSYTGVKGVYFKFDATGATKKADAKAFYLDDVVLHYGATDQIIRELTPDEIDREDACVTYAAYSDQFRYTSFDPIPLSSLEGKALHIELKLHGDGMAQIGYTRSIDWGHLSGLAQITKKGDKYTSTDITGNPVGKVTPLTDGWISFDYNYSEWYGEKLHDPGSTHVQMVQNEGTWEPSVDVSIFWLSLKVIDAYGPADPDFPDRPDAIKYEAGHDILRYNRFTPIALSDLEGKAISIQLKLLEDGEVTIGFLASNWAEIAYMVNVEKSGDTYTARNFWNDTPYGKINVLEDGDGWIELVVDYAEFKRESVAAYTEISLVYLTGHEGTEHPKPLSTDVGIDWSSLKITDAYGEYIPPEFPDRPGAIVIPKDVVNGTSAASVNFNAIELSELDGKAIYFEFYFKEEGSVAFALCDATGDWFNVTGPVTLSYNGDTVTASKGEVSVVGGGWYALTLNCDEFAGNGLSGATKADVFTKDWGTDWGAAFAVDSRTFRVVEAYEVQLPYPDRPKTTVYNAGADCDRHFITPISLSAVKEAGAISIELKFLGDGEIVIGFQDATTWAELAFNTVVTKNGDEYSSVDFWNDTNVYGRITVLEDGWIRLVIDYDEFKAENLTKYTEIGLVYITGREGTSHEKPLAVGVAVDWDSIAAVEGYIEPEVPEFPDRPNAKTIEKGAGNGTQFSFTAVEFSALEGKAIHFEFYFKEAGSVAFAIADDWHNATGTITLTYAGSTVTASKGIVYSIGDGWWAWEHNRVNFGGDGLAVCSKLDVIMKSYDALDNWNADVAIDLDSFRAVEANTQEEPPAQPDPDHPHTAEFGGGDSLGFNTDIPVEQLEGKAIHFEFKIEDDSTEFGFSLCYRSTWANCTGPVVIRKVNGVWTSFSWAGAGGAYGRVIEIGNGWYAWECNRADWTADRQADGWSQNPPSIGLLVRNGAHNGTVTVDLDSLCVVDAFVFVDRSNSMSYKNGDGSDVPQWLDPTLDINALKGKALHFEFKFDSDGSISFSLLANPSWKNVTGTITFTKAGNKVTASYGEIYALDDGWYAWECNFDDLQGDGKGEAENVGFAYTTAAVTADFRMDRNSFRAIDPIVSRTSSMTFKNGDGSDVSQWLDPTLDINALKGKALHFEFKFDSDGTISFALLAGTSWANVTGTITFTKTGNSVTASYGKVTALATGWYAWECNFDDLQGDGKDRAENVGFAYTTAAVTADFRIDRNSFRAIDAI